MKKRHFRIVGAVVATLLAVLASGCSLTKEFSSLPKCSENADPAQNREADLEIATLVRVIDGDTLLVSINGEETKIRLIGVDAPESVASDEYLKKTGKENTDEGRLASEFVKELLLDAECLWLEYDEERTDQYGRTLAYVWLSEDRTDVINMLNARLLMEGHATLMTVQPNVRHADNLSALLSDGRQKGDCDNEEMR